MPIRLLCKFGLDLWTLTLLNRLFKNVLKTADSRSPPVKRKIALKWWLGFGLKDYQLRLKINLKRSFTEFWLNIWRILFKCLINCLFILRLGLKHIPLQAHWEHGHPVFLDTFARWFCRLVRNQLSLRLTRPTLPPCHGCHWRAPKTRPGFRLCLFVNYLLIIKLD